jgi:ABC-type molybdate transport system substrate-binding protein
MRSPTPLAVGSLLLLAGLVAALVIRAAPGGGGERPRVVYVAASLRPVMERVSKDYEAATGTRVELRFGASEDILRRVEFPSPNDPADAFLPADDSYIRLAEKKELIADTVPLSFMRAVVLLPPKEKQRVPVTTWDDLTRPGTRASLANEGAAIGKLVRSRLTAIGKWPEVSGNVIGAGTVTESANATPVGAVDAAIVWDAVARSYPKQPTLELTELAGIQTEVVIARLKQARDPTAAEAFVRFTAGPGLAHFRELGFPVVK